MLEVRDLEVTYGKVRAVQGVSLDVAAGEIVCLVGANGAGKSSTMHAILGVERPAAGCVRFLGADITRLPPHRVVPSGLAQVPEGRLVFGTLTVRENLELGAIGAGKPSAAELDAVLDVFPVLRERLERRAGVLSGGQAQMLAVARGLMARPKLLMLDEPSLGLAPLAAADLLALVAALPARGVTVLLVEQNVRQALGIADRGYVLESGRIILEGAAAELARHPTLVSAYIGIGKAHGEAASTSPDPA